MLSIHLETLHKNLNYLEHKISMTLQSHSQEQPQDPNVNDSDIITEIEALPGRLLNEFFNRFRWDLPPNNVTPHGNWDLIIVHNQNNDLYVRGMGYGNNLELREIFQIRYRRNRVIFTSHGNETPFDTFEDAIQFLNERYHN